METSTSGAIRSKPAAPDAQPKGIGRLLFVDNIRVYLTVLVILHHLMVAYAGTGSWIYMEGRQDFITAALGLWFCATNQAYFMGLFLLIGAYFVPGSYDRKGAGRFLKDRLIRLGIPLAVYSWVINPIFVYALFHREIAMPFWRFYPVEYFKTNSLIGPGPLWFVEVLLIFSLVYVLWRVLVKTRPSTPTAETRFPGNGAIALFALLLGLASFLVRVVFYVDAYTFKPLNLQIPFFPQYIALFVVGLIAFRRNWFAKLPDATGRLWLIIAIPLILVFIPMMLALGAAADITPFKGGWHLQSMAYALWEAFICVSMCIGLVYAFRRYLNNRGRIAAFLVPLAYTAYIIHAPVITALEVAVRDVVLYPLIKWAVVALVAVPLCFGLSALIRKLPYFDRVL
jgi:glucan biosynthesis protein C